MVRAKFRCIDKHEQASGETTVKLDVVIVNNSGQYDKENEEFFKYTPYGSLNMGILNEKASTEFEIGKEYYIDFTKIE